MKCSICGKNLKDPTTSSHINSRYHQKALVRMGVKGKTIVTNKETTKQKRSKTSGDGVIQRILSLEKQMNFVIGKLNQLEEMILSSRNGVIHSVNKSSLKNTILINIPRNGSITIDRVAEMHRQHPWKSVKTVLEDLVDDQKIDVAEGNSDRKLFSKYGRVIRR